MGLRCAERTWNRGVKVVQTKIELMRGFLTGNLHLRLVSEDFCSKRK
jgi:hypothetical protein